MGAQERRTDRPGREGPKEYRDIIDTLIRQQGWRYDKSGKRHPVLYPPDVNQSPLPTTPGDRRSLSNFKADVRRRGGSI